MTLFLHTRPNDRRTFAVLPTATLVSESQGTGIELVEDAAGDIFVQQVAALMGRDEDGNEIYGSIYVRVSSKGYADTKAYKVK